MARMNKPSNTSAATEPAAVLLLISKAMAIANSTKGRIKAAAGASDGGTPKFFTASRVPGWSTNLVIPARVKTNARAMRIRTMVNGMDSCSNKLEFVVQTPTDVEIKVWRKLERIFKQADTAPRPFCLKAL